jgi:uroporphyrinogen decarboxylase
MVQVFDSWAGELSPTDFVLFSLPYLLQIPTKLHKNLQSRGYYPENPSVPTVVFAKGAWYALEDLAQSDYDVISLDWTHDPVQARQRVGPKKVLQGNMDPNVLYGPQDNITKHVERIVEGFGGGKEGYIVNLGHGITPVSPHEAKLITGCQSGRFEMVPGGKSSRVVFVDRIRIVSSPSLRGVVWTQE